MKVFKNPYFIVPVLLFSVNQILERFFKLFIPWVHSYLDDLLAIPLILGITLQIYQKIHPKRNAFSFTKVQILVAITYVAIVFELVLPRFSTTYTGDLLDVFCYFLGGFYFYFLINPPLDMDLN
ncbi:magnesium citrate secondary transporter [Algoriphagus litoralis]|uniref:magnesium citrate secondary transporter n=1 Tax=Algoriphagus litoralis TaxID=2202829 RepID=UPI000DB8FD1D|nr:magnesium citrate secondary transporter [Algoriphagus litoralis]